MPRFEYRCEYGQVFVTFAQEGECLQCPKCAKPITVSLKNRDPKKKRKSTNSSNPLMRLWEREAFHPPGQDSYEVTLLKERLTT